jgi:uncharacterized protein YkwD
MDNVTSRANHQAPPRRLSRSAACLLAAAILVIPCQSSGFSAQQKKTPEGSTNHSAERDRYQPMKSRNTDLTGGKESRLPPNGHKVRSMEEAVLLFTNEERSRAGLQPLEPSSALNYLARGQSRNMCAKGALRHESESFPRGWRKFAERLKIVGVRSGGENVAYRTASSETEKWAKQVVNGWMKSPPHRRNILTPRYLYLGVGIAMCKDDLTYATQVFSPDAGRLP